MRILIISWEYPPYTIGGMGKHIAEIVPALDGLMVGDEAIQIDVVTTDYAGGLAIEKHSDSTTIYRVPCSNHIETNLFEQIVVGNESLITYARQLGSHDSYDLIHIHDWLTGVAGVTLKHEWKVPLLVTMHATERGRHQGHLPEEMNRQIDHLEWRICYEAWRIIVCSAFMRGELNRYWQVPNDKIVEIPNGVSFEQLHRSRREEMKAIRQRYAPNGEHLLFYVGRIVYEKGLQVLVQAMPQILERYPNTKLLAAGKNGAKMMPLAQQLNVAHATQFLDYIENPQRDCLYQMVDAAIFPSLYEPFGIVALEAMALNCNVIASDVGGLGEVVQHMHNGLTVYPNDPESIAWAVDQLFLDLDAATQRRQRALRQVKSRYNWTQIAQRTVDLYQSVIEERRLVDW